MPLNLIKPTVLFTDHSINQYILKCFVKVKKNKGWPISLHHYEIK